MNNEDVPLIDRRDLINYCLNLLNRIGPYHVGIVVDSFRKDGFTYGSSELVFFKEEFSVCRNGDVIILDTYTIESLVGQDPIPGRFLEITCKRLFGVPKHFIRPLERR